MSARISLHYSPEDVIHATGIETNTFGELYAQKIAQQTIYAYHRTDFYHIFRYRGNHNTHYVEDKKLRLNGDSLLVLNKNILHRYSLHKCEGNMLTFSNGFFESMQEKADYLNRSVLLTGTHVVIPTPSKHCLAAVDAYFALIKQLQPEQKTGDRKKISDYLPQQYAVVLRCYVHNLLMTIEREYLLNQRKLIADSEKDKHMRQFKILLDKHYRTEKQVEFYAGVLGLTEKKLSSIVHSTHGFSAKKYINEKMFREACRQLRFTTLTLGEIAGKLGFDSIYFVKFFYKRTGFTPKKYRKNMKR
ncbi:MAG: AraC family transcriptional regulator [Tannerella sp.]|jgi:AraC-like DNA-binding protein|nr:AraC family transcriptional regulator [Tannerella sp.]